MPIIPSSSRGLVDGANDSILVTAMRKDMQKKRREERIVFPSPPQTRAPSPTPDADTPPKPYTQTNREDPVKEPTKQPNVIRQSKSTPALQTRMGIDLDLGEPFTAATIFKSDDTSPSRLGLFRRRSDKKKANRDGEGERRDRSGSRTPGKRNISVPPRFDSVPGWTEPQGRNSGASDDVPPAPTTPVLLPRGGNQPPISFPPFQKRGARSKSSEPVGKKSGVGAADNDECGCKSHGGHSLLDELYVCAASEVAGALFGRGRDAVVKEAGKAVGISDIIIEEWDFDEDNKWVNRSLTYDIEVDAPIFGLLKSSCVETQNVVKRDRRTLVIQSQTTTPQLPHAGAYTTHLHYCISTTPATTPGPYPPPNPPTQTRLRIMARIEFHARLALQDSITSHALETLKKWARAVDSGVLDELSGASSAIGKGEVLGRGRVRKRQSLVKIVEMLADGDRKRPAGPRDYVASPPPPLRRNEQSQKDARKEGEKVPEVLNGERDIGGGPGQAVEGDGVRSGRQRPPSPSRPAKPFTKQIPVEPSGAAKWDGVNQAFVMQFKDGKKRSKSPSPELRYAAGPSGTKDKDHNPSPKMPQPPPFQPWHAAARRRLENQLALQREASAVQTVGPSQEHFHHQCEIPGQWNPRWDLVDNEHNHLHAPACNEHPTIPLPPTFYLDLLLVTLITLHIPPLPFFITISSILMSLSKKITKPIIRILKRQTKKQINPFPTSSTTTITPPASTHSPTPALSFFSATASLISREGAASTGRFDPVGWVVEKVVGSLVGWVGCAVVVGLVRAVWRFMWGGEGNGGE